MSRGLQFQVLLETHALAGAKMIFELGNTRSLAYGCQRNPGAASVQALYHRKQHAVVCLYMLPRGTGCNLVSEDLPPRRGFAEGGGQDLGTTCLHLPAPQEKDPRGGRKKQHVVPYHPLRGLNERPRQRRRRWENNPIQCRAVVLPMVVNLFSTKIPPTVGKCPPHSRCFL